MLACSPKRAWTSSSHATFSGPYVSSNSSSVSRTGARRGVSSVEPGATPWRGYTAWLETKT